MLEPNGSEMHSDSNGSGDLVHAPIQRGVLGTPVEVIPFGNPPRAVNAAHGLLVGLLRHKWLILGIFFLISASVIPFIWVVVKPQYRSTAVLKVEPVQPTLVFQQRDDQTGIYSSYLNTEVGTIRSPKVLSRVLDKPRVQNTFWYTEEGRTLTGARLPAMERLPEDLSVLPRPQTYFIDISMYTQKPDEAKIIVDAVADAYVQFNEETRNDERTRKLDTLRKEREQLDLSIRGKVYQMHTLGNEIGTLDSKELRSKLSTQLSELDSKRAALEIEIRTLGDRINSLTRASETQPASDTRPAENLYYASDPEWRRLNIERKNAEGNLAIARLNFGPRNTRVQELQLAVRNAEALLKEREQQIEEEMKRGVVPGVAAVLSNDLKSLEEARRLKERERGYYDEKADNLRKKVKGAGDIALKLASLEQDVEHQRELYQEYQRRIEVLESEIKAPARVNIMSYGTTSSHPDRDRRFLFTAMVLAVAMGLGLSVGYLRASIDRKIHDLEEAETSTSGPFLGKLPRIYRGSLPPDLGGPALLPARHSEAEGSRARQALMESIRMVRTSLLERVARSGDKVLLITSSQSESGKSTVAVLLAKSLAVIGKRVLLVEGDLRRPALGQRLSIESGHGLAEVLAGKATEEQAIDGSRHLPFHAITAGEIPDDFDLELLSNGTFSRCLQRWRGEYDFVLLDSPPVLPVADARILAGHADGTIMVVRAGHDTRPDTVEAFSLLMAAGGNLLGTIFIGGDSERGYGYGRAYRYEDGYGYGVHGPAPGNSHEPSGQEQPTA